MEKACPERAGFFAATSYALLHISEFNPQELYGKEYREKEPEEEEIEDENRFPPERGPKFLREELPVEANGGNR